MSEILFAGCIQSGLPHACITITTGKRGAHCFLLCKFTRLADSCAGHLSYLTVLFCGLLSQIVTSVTGCQKVQKTIPIVVAGVAKVFVGQLVETSK